MDKYEEALERAKNHLYNDDLTLEQYDTIYAIFPELKNKDERIRKEIIDYIKIGTYKKDWIDWLEKQGNQPNKVSIWKHWKDGIAGNGNNIPVFLIKNGLTYSLSPCLSFECDYIELSELDNLYNYD